MLKVSSPWIPHSSAVWILRAKTYHQGGFIMYRGIPGHCPFPDTSRVDEERLHPSSPRLLLVSAVKENCVSISREERGMLPEPCGKPATLFWGGRGAPGRIPLYAQVTCSPLNATFSVWELRLKGCCYRITSLACLEIPVCLEIVVVFHEVGRKERP